MKSSILLSVFAAVLLAGCTTPTVIIDEDHDTSENVNDLDSRDFDRAAEKMISDMLSSGAVDRPDGKRYVLAISRVANRTDQDIDTDQLVKKIRVSLLNGGKVVVTTAVGGSGAEDNMTRTVRDLADDELFNANTVAKQGTVVAPDLSLSGKIRSEKHKINRSQQRIEYYFQLTLTDINSGLAIWEKEEKIIKVGAR